MRILNRKQTFFASLFVALLGAALISISAAMTLDLTLAYSKESNSGRPFAEVVDSVSHPAYWPSWFKRLHRARLIDIAGRDFPMNSQDIEVGSLIRLQFEPKRKAAFSEDPIFYTGSKENMPLESDLSVIEVQVRSFFKSDSELVLEFALESDPSGKIASQYAELVWKISVHKTPSGNAQIETEVNAKPSQFRAKLLGAIFRGISLTPLAFLDGAELASLTLPLSHSQLRQQFQR